MSDDIKIEVDGIRGKVTGTLKNVKDAWNDLPGEGIKTGHFFAFKITTPEKYLGKRFDYKRNGEIKGTALEAGPDEMQWVLRIDDHQNEIYSFESDREPFAEFDFSEVTLEE